MNDKLTVGRIVDLRAKGERMPQTPEQFQRMGDMYEKSLLERDEQISRLKKKINELEQCIKSLKRKVNSK